MKFVRDPLSDLFTRIRNANAVSHDTVAVPFSKFKQRIVDILKSEGYIENYTIEGDSPANKVLVIELKYDENGAPVLTRLKRISKSSKRLYVKKKDIPKVLNGFGTVILSTSSGVLSGKDARLTGVGGELIAEVY